MTLPATGPISMSQVATELGISATGLSLNDSRVRALAGKPSGAISMADLRGKSAVIREPATGDNYSTSSPTYFVANLNTPSQAQFAWNGTNVGIAAEGTTVVQNGGWWYIRGSLRAVQPPISYYGIYRQNVAP